MTDKAVDLKVSDLDCCPELTKQPLCDTLNFRYRLPFKTRVGGENQQIPVEVIFHFQIERCSGAIVMGDPIYSTTLLPGEQVRLFTSDRHARWSYDSESKLAYRHETTSEEAFYTAGLAEAMCDLTINEAGSSRSSYEESWASGGGGASFSILGLINIGGGGGGGSYDSESALAFCHSLSRHAESASRYVAVGVRAKSATSIGEVETRTHMEGESEEHYESSSRVFRNPNKCRAVTYLFYKLQKLQTIRFRLVAIERIVQDPKVPTSAYQRIPIDTTGRLMVLPQYISATHKARLEIEHMARTSAVERQQAVTSAASSSQGYSYPVALLSTTAIKFDRGEPTYSIALRKAAREAVDRELIKAGLLDEKEEKPTDKLVAELSWERTECLPTPGILVKGCLDKCDTCEPAFQKEIELDLERKRLENEMLKRQIELLEKSQEYRCCPNGTGELPDE